MKLAFAVLAMTLAVAISPVAMAHPGHHGPEEELTLKLVNKKNSAVIVVTSGDEKISTADAGGMLVVDKAGARQEVELVSGGKNTMKTKTAFKLAPGSKAKATITLDDGRVGRAVFDVK